MANDSAIVGVRLPESASGSPIQLPSFALVWVGDGTTVHNVALRLRRTTHSQADGWQIWITTPLKATGAKRNPRRDKGAKRGPMGRHNAPR